MRFRSSWSVLLVLPLAEGCAPANDAPRLGESAEAIVVGANDLRPVKEDGSNVPEELGPALDAIGRMDGIACTGTHVGNHLVLTAAHCLSADDWDDCESTSIEWGVRGNLHGEVGRCVRVLAAELTSDRDFALFEVDTAPEAQLAMDLCRSHGPGERVMVLGHPDRKPLVWSGLCALDDASVKSPGRITHVCDTAAGSSGGPVLDRETLRVIAIHSGGAEQGRAANLATLLFPIRELLAPNEGECTCSAP